MYLWVRHTNGRHAFFGWGGWRFGTTAENGHGAIGLDGVIFTQSLKATGNE